MIRVLREQRGGAYLLTDADVQLIESLPVGNARVLSCVRGEKTKDFWAARSRFF